MMFLPLLPELVVGVGLPLLMIGATVGGWTYVLGSTGPGQAVVTKVAGAGAAKSAAGASAAMTSKAAALLSVLG